MNTKSTPYRRLLEFFLQADSDPGPIVPPDPGVNAVTGSMEGLREAAVLLPVTRELPGRDSEIVLTVRSENLKTHAGQISLPGGSREARDPDIVATALRESREEIGVEPHRVEVIGKMGELALPSGFRVTPIIGLIDPESDFSPCPVEVADIFRVPLSLILDPGAYRDNRVRVRGVPRCILELYYEDYRIWGATAAILHHLARSVDEI